MNSNLVETTAHEYCPVCKEKGQIQVLRIYRLNLRESIFLCENPQCIYPLGYKPLNSIITSADSENYQVPPTHKKRKLSVISDLSPIVSHQIKARTNNVNIECTASADSVVKGYQHNFCIPKPSLHDVLQNDQQKPTNSVESCPQKVDFETATNSYQESPPKTSTPRTQLLANSELCSAASEVLLKDNDKGSTSNKDLCLQWRNSHKLCWLDCILSALVHLETLKFALAEECNETCLLQKLLTKYDQATMLLNSCNRNRVKDVLPKAESHLNEIRNKMFTQLQPQLNCELGKEESPVFALPLLLRMDRQTEKLFLHSFSVKFECVCCGYKEQNWFRKTLTTFTNIIPDWHPLKAIYFGPCNNCSARSQRRQMTLEKVPSILMFHFVEGLPHNNLKNYSFQFEGDTYQITSIVQYQTDKKHFITWSLNPDGTWLECDDLKGPYCRRHKRFEVPPSEIHIVIWEKKTSHVPEEPNTQFQCKNTEDFPLNNVRLNSTVLHCASDNAVDNTTAEHCKEDSVRTPHKEQQWVPEDQTTVHHGMENLAYDDIVTLILEEIKVDSEGKSLDRQIVRNNLVEMGTLQQESAFSPNTPYTREFAGASLASNNKCMLYENSRVCLPLEELNPANVVPPVPEIQNPDPRDSLLAQRADSRTNLPNREHGLNSELQLNTKLSPLKDIIQKSLDLKDVSKTVVNTQVANSAANKSFQPSHKDQKRAFVGSWVNKLSKNTFVPSSASSLKDQRSCKSPSMQKISEVRLPGKEASNFGGFQSRGTAKTTETPKSVVPQSGNTPPLPNFKGFSQSTCLPTASHASFSGRTWNKSGNTLGTSSEVTHSHSPGPNSVKAEESDSERTKKLRRKLLKKLYAKKKKLASLDRLALEQLKREKPVSGDVSTPSQAGSHDNELLQSFLRELQCQIDAANSESGCTSHSNSDEILAELLSPTSTVASLEAPKSKDECMYVEMVDSSIPVAVSDEQTSMPQAATSEDHNYYSPVKESHLDLLTVSKSNVKKLAFESPISDDIFEDLFSISAPSSVAGDIDLPHFDETLFETC